MVERAADGTDLASVVEGKYLIVPGEEAPAQCHEDQGGKEEQEPARQHYALDLLSTAQSLEARVQNLTVDSSRIGELESELAEVKRSRDVAQEAVCQLQARLEETAADRREADELSLAVHMLRDALTTKKSALNDSLADNRDLRRQLDSTVHELQDLQIAHEAMKAKLEDHLNSAPSLRPEALDDVREELNRERASHEATTQQLDDVQVQHAWFAFGAGSICFGRISCRCQASPLKKCPAAPCPRLSSLFTAHAVSLHLFLVTFAALS